MYTLHNSPQRLSTSAPVVGPHQVTLGSDHFVSSSDVTLDMRLDIEVGTERVRTPPAPGLWKIKMIFLIKTIHSTHQVGVRLTNQVHHGEAEAGCHEGLDVILHEMDHQGLAEVGRDAVQHSCAWQRSFVIIELFVENGGGGTVSLSHLLEI